MHSQFRSHILRTLIFSIAVVAFSIFLSFSFSATQVHAGYAADYQGLPWYCAEYGDGLSANITCQEAGLSNSLGSPAPRQCQTSTADRDSGANCGNEGEHNTYGVLSVHEVGNTNNGATQYLQARSNGARHGLMFVEPSQRKLGFDNTTSNLKGHHIDEEYVSTSAGRDQWAWVWYTQLEYDPPSWLETKANRCKGYGCWQRPYDLFSYAYDDRFVSGGYYKRRWQDYNKGETVTDNWNMTVTDLPGALSGSGNTIQIAPNQEVEIDWMCQDVQISQFGDQRGLFGLWDQWGYHRIQFFDAAKTTNLGGLSNASGLIRLTPTEDTEYTIQCKSSADIVSYNIYVEKNRRCDPTGACDSARGSETVTHTYPEKLGSVLSVFVDVVDPVDPEDPDDPATVTSISADPAEITLGIGDQTATITWQTDWVYSATVSGPNMETFTCSGTSCNGGHSVVTDDFTTAGVKTYTLEYTTYDTLGVPTVTTEEATVTVTGQVDPGATLEVRKATDPDDSTYASSVTIAEGEDVYLRWGSNEATCTSGTTGFTTDGSSEGVDSDVAEPTSGSKTYRVNCQKGANNDSASVTVNIVGELTLEADKTIVRTGDTVQLTWNLAGYDPTNCSLTGEGLSINPLTGGEPDPYAINIQGQSTYMLECNDGVNSSEDSVTIRVSATIFES